MSDPNFYYRILDDPLSPRIARSFDTLMAMLPMLDPDVEVETWSDGECILTKTVNYYENIAR